MDVEEATKSRLLLKSWGFNDSTVETFIDNFMDIFAIEHMSDDNMKAFLIGGQLIRFSQKRREWLESGKPIPPKPAEVILHLNPPREPDNKSIPKPAEVILPSAPPPQLWDSQLLNGVKAPLSLEILCEDDLTMGSNFASAEDMEILTTAGEGGKKIANDSGVLKKRETKIAAAEKLNQDVIEPASKRTKTYDILGVLKKHHKGQYAIKQYQENGFFTPSSLRNDVVSCIIEEELCGDMSKQIPHSRLQYLAKEIANAFPTETEAVYFDQYTHPKTGKKVARGKLVNKYYNIRRLFHSCGLTDDGSSKEKVVSSITVNSAVSGSLCWLEQNGGMYGNWPEVVEHWRVTSTVRMHRLLHEESAPSSSKTARPTAYDYMSKYPSLLDNSAYQLFEIDFRTLKPEVDAMALFSEWANLSLFLVQQIQKVEPDFLEDPTLTNGERILLILLNLSKIFAVINIANPQGKGKGKKTWRPSHVEVRDAFLRMFHTIVDLEEFKEARRTDLQRKKLPLQPFVAVVGPTEEPTQYLVCVDEHFYEVDSVLKALDVTFKCFFALHTPYPPEAEQLWLFIQRAVYKFEEKSDNRYSSVTTLCGEYQRFKKDLQQRKEK